MPSTSAARRASPASSIEQQPRAPDRYERGLRLRARCTPVTSWPSSTARAAATAESTPPDMAAITLTTRSSLCRKVLRTRLAGQSPLVDRGERCDERVDVGLGGGVPEAEPQRSARCGIVVAHRQQHVAGLGNAGIAGGTGGALDALGVQQHQHRVALAAGEGDVDDVRQPVLWSGLGIAVDDRVRDDAADALDHALPQRLDAGRRLGLAVDADLQGLRERGDERDADGA